MRRKIKHNKENNSVNQNWLRVGAEVRPESKSTKTDVKLYIMNSKIYTEKSKTHVFKCSNQTLRYEDAFIQFLTGKINFHTSHFPIVPIPDIS